MKRLKKVLGIMQAGLILALYSTPVFAADANTQQIDQFIDFACSWLSKIGGVVAMVGGIMFALAWQREDAEGKSKALFSLMAGFMLIAISQGRAIFGL